MLVAAFAVALFCALPGVAFADADTGGASPADPEFRPTGKAKLMPNGLAIAPDDAPAEVQAIIAAGNQIATAPYVYGGGHNTAFRGPGYDCSASVSFALHGGGLLDSPLPSSGFYDFGDKGLGRWITIYTKSSHMYMVVAGLRFDTSMRTPIAGAARRSTKNRRTRRARVLSSRWSSTMRPTDGYKVRHPVGF